MASFAAAGSLHIGGRGRVLTSARPTPRPPRRSGLLPVFNGRLRDARSPGGDTLLTAGKVLIAIETAPSCARLDVTVV
jgi:hypothetical protein